MESVPGAVATGSQPDENIVCQDVTRSLPLPVLTSFSSGSVNKTKIAESFSAKSSAGPSILPGKTKLLTVHRSEDTLEKPHQLTPRDQSQAPRCQLMRLFECIF